MLIGHEGIHKGGYKGRLQQNDRSCGITHIPEEMLTTYCYENISVHPNQYLTPYWYSHCRNARDPIGKKSLLPPYGVCWAEINGFSFPVFITDFNGF